MDTMTDGNLIDNILGAAGSLGVVGVILAVAIGWWAFRFFFRD